jgi:hypothetical protein
MRAKLLARLLVVGVLAVAGVVGYREWSARQLPAQLLPHVKNVSLRVANSLAYELQPSNITYKELFEAIDKHLTEIDSKIIDAQTLETAKNRNAVEPLLEYLRAVQEVLRAQQSMYRKQLELSSALDSARDAVMELRRSSVYGYDYAKQSADRAEERSTKASAEYAEARDGFRKALEKLGKARAKAARVAPPETLCDPGLTTEVLVKLAKESPA